MNETAPRLPPPSPRRWIRFALAGLIFACGAVVGAVVSRIATQRFMVSAIRNPEQVPDRILPRLISTLQLTDDQSGLVEEIVRRRHRNMETIRSTCYPEMIAEFSAMRTEIQKVLTADQQARWQELSDMVEQRFLPAPPAQ